MIFVDTGAFLGRHLAKDQHHVDATRVWEELRRSGESCLTSNFVVDEAATLIGRRAGHRFAAEALRKLYTSRALALIRPDAEDELTALNRFETFHDQGVSFTDCVSFVLMERRKIRRVFTFDHHFRIAGFEVVP
ncbi:MAG: type II toxin-antitoxin system VapC family toxin [bacterium]